MKRASASRGHGRLAAAGAACTTDRARQRGGSPWVSLHLTAADHLRHYAPLRRAWQSDGWSAGFCLSAQGRPLDLHTLHRTFQRRPTLPACRHTVAVNRRGPWDAAGVEACGLWPNPSVSLGHLKPASSACELTATPDLLGAAAQRFARYAGKGDLSCNHTPRRSGHGCRASWSNSSVRRTGRVHTPSPVIGTPSGCASSASAAPTGWRRPPQALPIGRCRSSWRASPLWRTRVTTPSVPALYAGRRSGRACGSSPSAIRPVSITPRVSWPCRSSAPTGRWSRRSPGRSWTPSSRPRSWGMGTGVGSTRGSSRCLTGARACLHARPWNSRRAALARQGSYRGMGKGGKSAPSPRGPPRPAPCRRGFGNARATRRVWRAPARGRQRTRHGVDDMVQQVVARAAPTGPSSRDQHVTPPTRRHTTAPHVLPSGVDLAVIARWLGHERPEPTQTSLEADLAPTEQALPPRAPAGVEVPRFRAKAEGLAVLATR